MQLTLNRSLSNHLKPSSHRKNPTQCSPPSAVKRDLTLRWLLCDGTTTSRTSPGAILSLSATAIDLESGSTSSNLFLRLADGDLDACGHNWSGNLGIGTYTAGSSTPVTVTPAW